MIRLDLWRLGIVMPAGGTSFMLASSASHGPVASIAGQGLSFDERQMNGSFSFSQANAR